MKVKNFKSSHSSTGRVGICSLAILLFSVLMAEGASTLIIDGPQGTTHFGTITKTLPNGNIIVTDTWFTPPGSGLTHAGAVFLYNGRTGALISMITGAVANAEIGNRVEVLTNGNYVITGGVWSPSENTLVGASILCSGGTGCSGQLTPANSFVSSSPPKALLNGNYLILADAWDRNGVEDGGAVVFCSGVNGCVGTPTPKNSLFGTHAGDQIGSDDSINGNVIVLENGDYIIVAKRWNNNRGSVTYCSGTTGCTGAVSENNSSVGSNENDRLGNVTTLSNGKYVVSSLSWNSGIGAFRVCDIGACSGPLSAANSMIGRTSGDLVGSKIVALANGNFVAIATEWDLTPSFSAVGAVTFCNTSAPCIGEVNESNSLTGSATNERVGEFGAVALPNGNYLVRSPSWGGGRGAVTFGNGNTGIHGFVTPQNSLVGTPRIGGPPQDHVGERQYAVLTNGDYVIASRRWFDSRGAATFCNGNSGCTGEVNASNSLMGTTAGDQLGVNIIPLTNGNYVVAAPTWTNGSVTNAGAVVFCRGDAPCLGPVTTTNCLFGTNVNDNVGDGAQPLVPLTNGNYLVISEDWNGARGAVTWGNGSTGTVGPVSAQNSLVGTRTTQPIATSGVFALSDGNYAVSSPQWGTSTQNGLGAVTWGNGQSGVVGEISPSNSLVGLTPNDFVGTDGFLSGVYPLSTGGYVIRNRYFNNGNLTDTGAITLGLPGIPITGPVNSDNSVIGRYSVVPLSGLVWNYDYLNRQLIVGLPFEKRVVLFRYLAAAVSTDFDGDRKTDISIFRPSLGQWWVDRSTAGVTVHTFGVTDDRISPGDFTGDGKTDPAIYRAGQWFVLRSDDNSYYSFPYGLSDDIPVPGDYDGDGMTDAAVFRESTGTWHIQEHSGNSRIESFGSPGDTPIPADFDGDGKTDPAVFRSNAGQWWVKRSTAGTVAVTFGAPGDKPVPGDFTGDGKADIAIWRPEFGQWFVLRSEDQTYYAVQFGSTGDVPVAGDYDGDGKFDVAVYRAATATWYVSRSHDGLLVKQFGNSTDVPIPGFRN